MVFFRVDSLPKQLNFSNGYFKAKSFSFYLEGISSETQKRCLEVCIDPVIEEIYENGDDYKNIKAASVAEVWFKDGVTDNLSHTASEALDILGVDGHVKCSHLYFFKEFNENETEEFIEQNIANLLIESYEVRSLSDFCQSTRFNQGRESRTPQENEFYYSEVNLDCEAKELQRISSEGCLALSLDEMLTLKSYIKSDDFLKYRDYYNLPNTLTDLELEVIAQTWSEHCKHKIFSSYIKYTEDNIDDGLKPLNVQDINSLYKSTIKLTTEKIKKEKGYDWLVSVFEDNAGIVRFFEDVDLCIKVETHNSPSALDPYGGALTGILGVNRDILGTGLGAKPIANTNVFCVGPYEWSRQNTSGKLPANIMRPRKILEGIHHGVQDGGNKSGIPTVNGAMVFDQDYCGKPLVFCGTVGALPPKLADGRSTSEKKPQCGDLIVVVGGGVGADGIHGATFSSLELNESSPRSAVQIGDPLTQKRVLDFILEARDKGLIRCITDNGAGGISSSIGEMASLVGGAKVNLELHPTKYSGLKPWEIMVSESQERMTLAVCPSDWHALVRLSEVHGVSISSIGEFTQSGFLEVYYKSKCVGCLNLEFLHDGLPQMKLVAHWSGSSPRVSLLEDSRETLEFELSGLKKACLKLLSHPNIANKDYWIRQYDHEVQARTVAKPLSGINRLSPSNSSVISVSDFSHGESDGVAIGCGLAPLMSQYDPYLMSIYAVDETIRNLISSGADISKLCLLDNFCWPDPISSQTNPDGDYKLGQLVRACIGLKDICLSYGTPLVSGKDSMKNDYRGRNHRGEETKISIQPTLLVTGLGKVDLDSLCSPHFKEPGDQVFLISASPRTLVGSLFLELFKTSFEDHLVYPDLEKNYKLYLKIHELIRNGELQSCHDLSEGGLFCALAESCLEMNLGLDVKLPSGNTHQTLFSEGTGAFVLSVKKNIVEKVKIAFAEFEVVDLGQVIDDPSIHIVTEFEKMSIPLNEAKKAWLYDWEKENA